MLRLRINLFAQLWLASTKRPVSSTEVGKDLTRWNRPLQTSTLHRPVEGVDLGRRPVVDRCMVYNQDSLRGLSAIDDYQLGRAQPFCQYRMHGLPNTTKRGGIDTAPPYPR